MRELANNNSIILCICHIDRYEVASVIVEKQQSSKRKQHASSRRAHHHQHEHRVEIWCGLSEGKIAVVEVRPSDLFACNQIVLDHYDNACVRASSFGNTTSATTLPYIGSGVPLAERNDIFTLVASSLECFVWSVLYTGRIIAERTYKI